MVMLYLQIIGVSSKIVLIIEIKNNLIYFGMLAIIWPFKINLNKAQLEYQCAFSRQDVNRN